MLVLEGQATQVTEVVHNFEKVIERMPLGQPFLYMRDNECLTWLSKHIRGDHIPYRPALVHRNTTQHANNRRMRQLGQRVCLCA